jgi:hypothetical protein
MNIINVPALNAPPLTELPLGSSPLTELPLGSSHATRPSASPGSVVAGCVTPSALRSLPPVSRGGTMPSRLYPAARPSAPSAVTAWVGSEKLLSRVNPVRVCYHGLIYSCCRHFGSQHFLIDNGPSWLRSVNSSGIKCLISKDHRSETWAR